jgi:hypothetical protein
VEDTVEVEVEKEVETTTVDVDTVELPAVDAVTLRAVEVPKGVAAVVATRKAGMAVPPR